MTDLSSLNLLEEKIKKVLLHVEKVESENEKIKIGIEEGTSIQTIFNQKKKQEIQSKIQGMLELLKNFWHCLSQAGGFLKIIPVVKDGNIQE